MQKNGTEWKKWISWFLFAISIIAFYKILDNLGNITEWFKGFINILMPFIMAVLLAYLLYLPCKKLESIIAKAKFKIIRNKARWLSILIVYLIVILMLVIIIKFIVPTVYESLMELINTLPSYYKNIIESFKELPEDSIWRKIDVEGIIEKLKEVDLAEYFSIEKVTEYIKGIIGFSAVVFDTFVTVAVSVYLLAERGNILKFIRRLCGSLFSNKTYQKIGKYFRESNEVFFRFLSSQLLDAIVVGILTSIAMSILQVKYAILLGFIIGLFNLIPYLGAIIAVVLAIIITIFTGGITKAIWMAIVVIILQQIDANIINPKIIGNSLEISPILIIFSVTVIGAYFGIMGMFLAVPIMAIIKIILNDFIRYRESKKNLN